MGTDPERALVYVNPGPRAGMHMAECAGAVDQRGYDLTGVVLGKHGGGDWRTLVDQVDVIVVYDLAELPADRRPRVEAATDTPAAITPHPRVEGARRARRLAD